MTKRPRFKKAAAFSARFSGQRFKYLSFAIVGPVLTMTKVQPKRHMLGYTNIHGNHLTKCGRILPINLPVTGETRRGVHPLLRLEDNASNSCGVQGRGPTRLISPRSTLKIWGEVHPILTAQKSPSAYETPVTCVSSLVIGQSACINCTKIALMTLRLDVYAHGSEFQIS